MKGTVILTIILGIVAVIAVVLVKATNSPQTPTASNTQIFKDIQSSSINSTRLSGIMTSYAPWNPEISHLKERLYAIGLPALPAEGTVLHIHQHLDIYINGIHVQVPAGIGINEEAGFIAPIHTHDTTDIIHVESPVKKDFTLGQFFDIWGLRFTSDCIGGYCSNNDKKLRVFLNGKEYTGNFRDLVLAPHQEIVVTYGAGSQLPNPIPSSFNFPQGY